MRFSIRGIFGVVSYAAICFAALTVNWSFASLSALLHVCLVIALLIATVGGIYELGERRAFCIGFATFGWVFWVLEFTIDIWRFAPIWTMVDHMLDAVAWELPDSSSLVARMTCVIGVCFLGGRIAMSMYRRNYPSVGETPEVTN